MQEKHCLIQSFENGQRAGQTSLLVLGEKWGLGSRPVWKTFIHVINMLNSNYWVRKIAIKIKLYNRKRHKWEVNSFFLVVSLATVSKVRSFKYIGML